MMFATSFAIRLDKSAKLAEEKHPIVLQVTFDRKVRRKRLGLSATVHQWDFDNHEFKKGVHGRREKNQKLEDAENKAKKIYHEHFENRSFNFKKFSELFSEKPVGQIGVIEFCLKVSQKFLKNGQARSSNDYRNIASAISKVSPNDLTFTEFTEEWLQEFEDYFTSRGTRCYNYMVHLRALFNKAVKKKVADFRKNPFKNPYTNPYGYEFARLKKLKLGKVNPNRIKDLSKSQLIQLVKYSPTSAKEDEYLSVWWFSFYLFGVNLTDIALLERPHIKDNRWFYERSKTGSGLKGGKPIIPEAMEIIKKYDTGEKYIFPILNNGYDKDELTKVNRIRDYSGYIRKTGVRVSNRIGFDGYFTYYSARYSSATLALNEGADRNTVSHLLDHENFSTIDNYAGRADNENILKAMEILRLKDN